MLRSRTDLVHASSRPATSRFSTLWHAASRPTTCPKHTVRLVSLPSCTSRQQTFSKNSQVFSLGCGLSHILALRGRFHFTNCPRPNIMFPLSMLARNYSGRRMSYDVYELLLFVVNWRIRQELRAFARYPLISRSELEERGMCSCKLAYRQCCTSSLIENIKHQ